MPEQWWKKSVVYQIYPRSFMDSNGDGIGDLRGIISKLDYLKYLGVDVLWLSPIYQSPNDDNGYDISNYRDIMEEFGTLSDFDDLLTQAHQRGLKIVMDLVVNHTSDEHPWFSESRQSRTNPFRDYYIWADKPNDWSSFFGGSAWEYDQNTKQYYLHLFSKKQPDLNWGNPKVRAEVYDAMHFWLKMGIDGFRMDVINLISKHLPSAAGPTAADPALINPTAQSSSAQGGAGFYVNGPRVHEYLQEMHHQVLAHYDIMTVGETLSVTPEDAILYTGEDRGELNMVFQFEHMGLDSGSQDKWDVVPWKLSDLKRVMSRWQNGLHQAGWNSLYLNNHDQPRMVSRFGDDTTYRIESATMLATFLHFMQGTPFLYQGEEIGMTNVPFASIEECQDLETLNMWQERVHLQGEDPELVLQAIRAKGRDNARTPMQWNTSKHAGFTTGTPWIPANPNYAYINVEESTSNPNSVFHYYRKLIQMRKDYPIILDGKYDLILAEHEQIFSYTRTLGNEVLLVILNFSAGAPEYRMPDRFRYGQRFSQSQKFGSAETQLLVSNYRVEDQTEIHDFTMRPYEARVYLFTGI